LKVVLSNPNDINFLIEVLEYLLNTSPWPLSEFGEERAERLIECFKDRGVLK